MIVVNKQDKEALNKLRINQALELALFIPHKYDNLTLFPAPKIGEINVVEIVIQNVQTHSKLLKIFATAWNNVVEIVIFNPKSFHYLLYKVGSKFFIQAKLEYSFGKMQFVQPKIVSEVGTVYCVYKTSLQQKTIRRVINSYLNIQNLMLEGLSEDIAKDIINFHNPKNSSIYENEYEKCFKSLKFVEVFIFLKKLNEKKRVYESISILNGDEKEFVSNLPFTLTCEQQSAILDIKNDFNDKYATRRVIMGDVGSGKTVIIFASVMMAYPKKSILMAPTTILAKQLFDEARKLLPKHLNICLLTSKNKGKNLEKVDFIIGTHVLLYMDLPKCDLVMIDEQHRFGTAQRETIHKLVQGDKNKHAHFLQFTATPIPRTLSMIHSSIIKYSFIKKTPFVKDIDTFIIGKDGFANMLKHIKSEIKNEKQVAIIYPLVEASEVHSYQSIDEGRAFWEKRYSNVYVTHGKDKNKEEVLEGFRENGNILLATTVIEVGISLPRLSTIIIVGAEYLGLATLHQLRGRVSRNGLKGYCYLYTNSKKTQRLEEFSKTKSGFDIAELDLKYRQSGDLFAGILQHGVNFKWFSLKDDKEILKSAKKSLNLND